MLRLPIRATAVALMLTSIASADELRYEAVWHSGSGTNIVTGPEPRADFIATGEDQTGRGRRLIDVETAKVDGEQVYTGLWVGGTGANLFDGPIGPIDLREAMTERRAQGLRVVDFEISREPNGGRRYLAVWRPGTGEEILTGPMQQDAFLARGQTLVEDQGLRLIDVEVERQDGVLLYSGLFRTGDGGNMITTPLRRRVFVDRREEFREQGLELVDVERVRVGASDRFVGVWASGDGEGQLTRPRPFDDFVALGAQQTADGFRTNDIELQVVATAPPPDPDPDDPPSGGPSVADLPDLPRWIDVSGGDDLVLDFGVTIDGQPRLTLPTSTNVGPLDYLPDYLPRDEDGNLVIPDNFCGINVRRASSFQWQKDGETVTDFPYNRVDDVAALPGEHDFLGGIDFTGPIGACAEANEPWQFFQPLTQHGGDSPVPGMRLVIEMGPGSELEFLNFNFHPGEALNAHELFGEDISEKIKAIAEAFEAFELDNGYCSIDNYVQKVCEEEEEGEAPVGSCPVGGDFASPC